MAIYNAWLALLEIFDPSARLDSGERNNEFLNIRLRFALYARRLHIDPRCELRRFFVYQPGWSFIARFYQL
jgi:hypothetical protein